MIQPIRYWPVDSKEVELRVCLDCCKELPVTEFTKGTNRYRCNACHRVRDNNYRRTRLPMMRERKMLYNIRDRAKQIGVICTLTLADIIIPLNCPVFHRPFVYGTGWANDWSPTIDRIVPVLGYVPGNIQIISFKANTMKSNATPAEQLLFSTWLQAQASLYTLQGAI